MFKRLFIIFIIQICLLVPFKNVSAESLASCDNRLVTIVNPVRGRNLWFEKSLKPIDDQYQKIHQNSLHATWLLQYDTLQDKELMGRIQGFDKSQELGAFLEISQSLADKARVIYPYDSPWFSPRAVFLSSYTQSEKKKIG